MQAARSPLHGIARCAGAAALLGLLCAAAATGRPLRIEVSPAAPTWDRAVTVTVEGTGCAPALSPFAMAVQGGLAFTAYVVETCGVVAAAPFRLQQVLPPLPQPGTYRVNVVDPEGATARLEFTAYEIPSLEVELPATVVAGDAVPVRLVGRGGCVSVGHELDAGVLEIRVDSECAIPVPPPPYHVFDFAFDLPALPAGDYEVRVLDFTRAPWDFAPRLPALTLRRLRVVPRGACLDDDTTLCLRGNRFRVTGTWRDFAGDSGAVHARPLPGNEGSGLLWFFRPDNVEITVKILDGCGYNDRWWVFLASGSTVEYELRVEDTRSGEDAVYRKAPGTTPRLIADTSALEGCP